MKKFAVLFTLVIALALASAGEKGKGKREMKCKGEAITFSEDFKKTKKECREKYKPTSSDEEEGTTASSEDGEKKKWKGKGMRGNSCVDLCQWKKDGTFKEDGTYDADAAKKNIEAMYPKAVQEEVIKAVNTCAETNRGSFNNKEDNKCEGYKDFRRCQFKEVAKICGLTMGGRKGKGKKGKKDKGEDEPTTESAE